MTDLHKQVDAALKRHGINPRLRKPSETTVLANELLIALDETHVEVWGVTADDEDPEVPRVPDDQTPLEIRAVDRVGATTRNGAADREALMDLRDQAKRLRAGLERLSPMRSSIVEAHLPARITDTRETIRRLEQGLSAAIADMGEPHRGKGNRLSKDSESAVRMLAELRAAGVTDEWKCAGVIAEVLTIVGRGSYSQQTIYAVFVRLREK